MTPPPPLAPSAARAAHLPRGAEGVVTAVVGRPGTAERLAALGIVPGTALRVIRGGSPMAVAVGDARLGLGRDWAEALVVEPR